MMIYVIKTESGIVKNIDSDELSGKGIWPVQKYADKLFGDCNMTISQGAWGVLLKKVDGKWHQMWGQMV